MKFWKVAFTYAIVGLLFGVYYRELARFFEYSGQSTLSNLHVHALVLGMMMNLLIIVFDRSFNLSKQKNFSKAYILYNIGVALLLSMNLLRGTLQVTQIELAKGLSSAISGIAGLTHISLSVGLIWLLWVIKQALQTKE